MINPSSNSSRASVVRCLQKYYREDIPHSSTPISELRLDSLDLIEALFELEQIHDRTLSNLEIASLSTIEDLVRVFATPMGDQ